MPLGNGDVGINVWVEPSGDVVMLVGKSDSYDEFNRLLKLGRIRVQTTPPLVTPGEKFSQQLRVQEGTVEIATATATLRVWVDANHPVVQVDCESRRPLTARVTVETWRLASREVPGGAVFSGGSIQDEGHSCWGNWPEKKAVNADTILPAGSGRLAWCHHNVGSQWRKNLEHTGLGAEVAAGRDPILNRCFGAVVQAQGFVAVSDVELTSAEPSTGFCVQVVPLTAFADSATTWRAQAERVADGIPLSTTERHAAHIAWWRAFWDRSHIVVTPADATATEELAATETVTRAYALQRFLNACAGRGALPIKFNGSLFTIDEHYDADFRAWGGGYWWQNTRAAYWTMPYAGDYDLMAPLFRMYLDALPLRMAAAQTYYGHEGAFYPETMYFWGNYMDAENYGLDREGKPDGYAANPWIRRYWQSGIELVAMMLDTYDGTQDPTFRDEALIPIATQIALFYDQHWMRDADGTILFDPAQSLETWHTATDPLPEIAGLRFVLPRLLVLPADEATKAQWRRLLADLPAVPVARDEDGRTRLAPAASYTDKRNVENPELYGVFPYRLYTAVVGNEAAEQALNAWGARLHPEDYGWQQNVIQAPLLGLAGDAQAMVRARAVRTAGYRFPAFFGPNYDWTPEQCHGTNMMTALQRMLMQCEGDRIVLLPAWPRNWNAEFKLHAPKRTTVEARIEDGRLMDLKVIPESRRGDVEVRVAQ